MSILRIPSFGTGINVSGAPDTRAVTDVLGADSVDLQPRGALVLSSDITDFINLTDNQFVPTQLSTVYLLGEYLDQTEAFAIGQGFDFNGATNDPVYLFNLFTRTNPVIAPVGGITFDVNSTFATLGAPVVPTGEGAYVSTAVLAGTYPLATAALEVAPFSEYQVLLLNIGAREGFYPRTAPGLYAVLYQASASASGATMGVPYPIIKFDALGTGYFSYDGDYQGGSESQQLYPRGIIAYNNHVFAWGFDAGDTVYGEGPTRVMFSNLGLPIRWGNDNQGATGTNREFTDSDAIVLGGAGELIRAAIVWNGKLWFFTNQQGHYIAGYGRDSFLTDGATAVLRAYNVVGPNAVIEGPDRQLYGVCDQGLWRTADGNTYDPLFRKLVDFAGRSAGYWDLLWTDPSAIAADYPGRTNKDLIWMAVDYDREQVLVGIPFCNATTGEGYGTDTVVIKYHPRTGGFTRQVFEDVWLTAPGYFRAAYQQPPTRFLGVAPQSGNTHDAVQFYAAQTDVTDSPVLPTEAGDVTFGYYAPYGPDGDGVLRTVYLVLSWEPDTVFATQMQFTVATTVDDNALDTFALYVDATEPIAPVTGDYWVDLSESDTSIGNDTASGDIPARPGYLLKTRLANGTWIVRPGLGGAGERLTIPMPVTRAVGTRYTVQMTQVSTTVRYSFEGLALDAAAGKAES